MQRARAIFLMAVLIVASVLLSFPWWGNTVQTLFAADAGPGVKAEITNVDIPGDNRPVITFTLTDGKGNALQTSDIDANSLRYTIARISTDPSSGQTSYFNYVTGTLTGRAATINGQDLQPAMASAVTPAASGDTGGTLSAVGGGIYKYTFKNALPSDFPNTATHVAGIQATRGNRAFATNDTFSFVPAGGTPITRQVVTTAACNQCHDPLRIHGSARIEVDYCVLCHTPENVDPSCGNSLDFRSFIHKIHNASSLPSVVAGKPLYIGGANHDFTGISWTQDIRNCTTCHKDAPQADNWKNAPNNSACTSCHDNVNALTGQNHAGGAQTDATCKNCHSNTMTSEFDLSVPGAHVIPVKSSQLRGVNFDLVSFTNTRPGQNPTVVFSIKDKAGATISPSEMSSLSLVLSGSTYEYQTEPTVSEDARAATPVGDGTFSYTYKAAIPSEATGTWTVGIQGYISTAFKGPGGQDVTVRDIGGNKLAYGAVTDATPMPRKRIVAVENCNQCHKEFGPAGLSVHGGSRNDTQFCVLCHNPNRTGVPSGVTDPAPVTINFTYLIHRIHTGEEGVTPYKVGSHEYAEVGYPGDRRNCQKCHLPGSNLIDFMREGAQPTIVRERSTPETTTTGRVVNNTARAISVTPPITNACTSCHDSSAARRHAALQTTSDGVETCIVCHGEDSDFSVSKSHARVGP